VVYSARLLWRTVSSTRVLVSVLNVERKNVPASTTRHPEIENQHRYQQNRDEKSWGSFGLPNAVKVRRKEMKTKRKERGSKLKCHLCKLVLFGSLLLPFPSLILPKKAQITNNPTPDSQTSRPPHTPPPPPHHQHTPPLPPQNTLTHHPPTPSPWPTSQSPNPSLQTHRSAPPLSLSSSICGESKSSPGLRRHLRLLD
jgi:hypothetical protein